LHLFEEGIHARAYSAAPEEYTSVVTDFITKSDK
jgi:hypothetical protein